MSDLRPFLRLQTDSYLTSLRDSLATEISDNVEFHSLQMSGKGVSSRKVIKVEKLASWVAQVLIERGLQGSNYKAADRMTVARFA
jgi:hypothetical protein